MYAACPCCNRVFIAERCLEEDWSIECKGVRHTLSASQLYPTAQAALVHARAGGRQRRWDLDYLALARFWAERKSKDPSTQTGAVIVRPDLSVASMGYNGFPKGMSDDSELYRDREVKYSRVVHCEMNAVLLAREPLHGYTLYTWPFASCDRCAVHMVQAGIRRAVAPVLPTHLHERWFASVERTRAYFKEAGVRFDELECDV